MSRSLTPGRLCTSTLSSTSRPPLRRSVELSSSRSTFAIVAPELLGVVPADFTPCQWHHRPSYHEPRSAQQRSYCSSPVFSLLLFAHNIR